MRNFAQKTKKNKKEGLDFYLVGGYNDEESSSVEITKKILNYLSKQPEINVNLKLLYTANLNTTKTTKANIPKVMLVLRMCSFV